MEITEGCAQVEAQAYISRMDCPEYLRRAERRLAEESERVANYMDASTDAKVTRVLETELIARQARFCCFRAWGFGLSVVV